MQNQQVVAREKRPFLCEGVERAVQHDTATKERHVIQCHIIIGVCSIDSSEAEFKFFPSWLIQLYPNPVVLKHKVGHDMESGLDLH